MEPLEIGGAVAVALGAVKLAEVAVTAVRDAYRKNGKAKSPVNGTNHEVVEWLKEINASISNLQVPLSTISTDIKNGNKRTEVAIEKLDDVIKDTTVLKDRGLTSCPLSRGGGDKR
jgi:hypothetical protein